MRKLLLLSLLLISCSGGGGGGGNDYAYPSYVYTDIPEITLSATFGNGGRYTDDREVFQHDEEVNLEVDLYDYDKNMKSLIVNLTSENNEYYYTFDLSDPSYHNDYNEIIFVSFSFIFEDIGQWELCSYIVDESGNESEDKCQELFITN